MNNKWARLLHAIPKRPGELIDWDEIAQTPIGSHFEKMAATPQQPEWHGEGDVLRHTKLVCTRLTELSGYWAMDERQRSELFIAALLHDIGKPKTTITENGRLTAPKHSRVGAQMARELLWTDFDLAGTAEAQAMRETICLLIRYHSVPTNLLKRDEPERVVRRIAANGKNVPDFTIGMLCRLAMADIRGRIADDVEQLCDLVSLCEEVGRDAGCLNGPYMFRNDYTEHAYLNGKDMYYEAELFDDTYCEAVMLCGLPGTGKDTWIAAQLADLPVLSLDDIRRELRVKPTDDQGRVVQECQRRAKELLAARRSFVFNGTNITDMQRGKWARLFEDYHARVHMIFLETDLTENLRRNSDRSAGVPEYVISELLRKLTPPEAYEAQIVEWKTV